MEVMVEEKSRGLEPVRVSMDEFGEETCKEDTVVVSCRRARLP